MTVFPKEVCDYCVGAVEVHAARWRAQLWHAGRASSHLTLRALQRVQPPRDFLKARRGIRGAVGSGASPLPPPPRSGSAGATVGLISVPGFLF